MYSPQHHRRRRLFARFLIVVYLISVSLVIPYVLGYRFNFRDGLFAAGSVTVRTNPKDVDIYVDGRKVTATPRNFINDTYHVTGLSPGQHSLRVWKEGFRAWENTATVESKRSTEFWNILLLRENFPRQTLSEKHSLNFYPGPDEKILLILQKENSDPGIFSVSVIEEKSRSPQELFSSDKWLFAGSREMNVEWSPNGDYVVVPVTKIRNRESDNSAKESDENFSDDFLIIETRTGRTLRLRRLLPSLNEIVFVRWDPHSKNTLSILSGNTLLRWSLEKASPEILSRDVLAATITGNDYYYLSNRDFLVYRLSDGNNRRQITRTPAQVPQADEVKIFAYDEKRLVVLSDGDLSVYNVDDRIGATSFEPVASGIRGVHFSDDGKKLLYWSDNEISVLFLRDWETQPVRKKGEKFTLVRFAEKIDNVQWVKYYEHVLFTVGKDIKITELDNRGRRHTDTLLSVGENTVVRSDLKNNRIYFLNRSENSQLQYITFPEEK